MKFRDLIIKANKITLLCKEYNVRWHMDLGGITIYYNDHDTGTWFPLASCEKAIPLIMKIANVDSTSQTSLDRWL